jgi:hypothetical protein
MAFDQSTIDTANTRAAEENLLRMQKERGLIKETG